MTILALGCSPGRRMGILLKNHPELTNTDTITKVIKGVHKDTVVSVHYFFSSNDTIVIHKDRLTERIYHYHDSLFVQGDCAADTIKVPVRTIVTEKNTTRIGSWLPLLAGFALLSEGW